MNPFIEDLRKRGILQEMTPGLEEELDKGMVSGYIGFDPTSDSLHIGNLAQLILLKRFQNFGHKPYVIIGVATAQIGDPSGKANERQLMDKDTIYENYRNISLQITKYLDFHSTSPNVGVEFPNSGWMEAFPFLEFIRDIGKHITVGYMLAKDSVKSRLENGLSFTEFSYQLIQAYDFYWLNGAMDVKLQMGGSDQWGNITTGIDLIRKRDEGQAFGLVTSLVTKTDGTKFGKTESGNIWLDPKKTSPYQFYQYWLNLSDDDAIKMFPIFSLMDMESISLLIERHYKNTSSKIIQNWLADEMTELVHGKEAYERVKIASNTLFGKGTLEVLKEMDESLLLESLFGVPQVKVSKNLIGSDVITFLQTSGIFPSKSEARKMIANNGVSINKEKVDDKFLLKNENLLHEKYLLVQKGKKYTLAIFS